MERTGTPVERGRPLCTIVVPTRRRPLLLAECLESIATSDYPVDRLEVIVVDDGGGSVEGAVESVAGRLETAVLRCPGIGPAAARNAGAARARGEILAFTDDDCRVNPHWLGSPVAAPAGEPPRAGRRSTPNPPPPDRGAAPNQ